MAGNLHRRNALAADAQISNSFRLPTVEKLGITPAEAEEYREKELKFQKKVTGKRKSMGEIRATIGTYAVDPQKLMEKYLQEILDRRIQIYLDKGKGFSEQESYYLPDVYVDEYQIEAEIPFDGNVTALRIDPADRYCIVRVKELLLNGIVVPVSGKAFTTNGVSMKNDTFLFATTDPNMTVLVSQLPRTGENVLSVKLEVAPLPQDMAGAMAEGNKKKWFKG